MAIEHRGVVADGGTDVEIVPVPRAADRVVPEDRGLPPIGDGQVLVKGLWLSLDPYMRGRMNEGPSYVQPVAVDAVMCGEVAGEVIESRHPKFAVGDKVAGDLGWQQYAISDGKGLRKLAPVSPLIAQLSVCGMPGITAYVGDNWQFVLRGTNVTDELGLTESNSRIFGVAADEGGVLLARPLEGSEINFQAKYLFE